MSESTPQGPPAAPTVAPDWYPDPEVPDQLRYWDGQMWTEHRAPARTGLSAIGDWLTSTFGAFGRCWKDLAILFVIFSLPFAILTPILFVYALDGLVLEGIDGLEVTSVFGQPQFDATNVDPDAVELVGFRFERLVPLIALSVVGIVVSLVHGNAVRHRTFWANRNVPTTWKRSAAVGLKRAPRKLLWVIVMVLIYMLPLVIWVVVVAILGAAVGGGAALAVGLILGLGLLVLIPWLWTRLSMVLTGVAVSSASPLKSSWKMSGTALLGLFLRLFLWAILAAVAGSILASPGQVAFTMLDFTELSGVSSYELVNLLGGSIFSVGALVFWLTRSLATATTGAFTAAAEGVLYHQLTGPADEQP